MNLEDEIARLLRESDHRLNTTIRKLIRQNVREYQQRKEDVLRRNALQVKFHKALLRKGQRARRAAREASKRAETAYEKGKLEDLNTERRLQLEHAAYRDTWPPAARGGGTCSIRGEHGVPWIRDSDDRWPSGPPVVIWHNFGERSFEREMRIPWRRR